MVIAHELGMPLKQRSHPYGTGPDGLLSNKSWEVITGWGETEDDFIEETSLVSPYEKKWELDAEKVESDMVRIFY